MRARLGLRCISGQIELIFNKVKGKNTVKYGLLHAPILAVQMLISFDADLYEIIGCPLQVSLVAVGAALVLGRRWAHC